MCDIWQDRIISRNLPLMREEVSREEAEQRIKAINEPYKLEILEGIKTEPITIYHIGDSPSRPQILGLCSALTVRQR